jgi:hypothetical protein
MTAAAMISVAALAGVGIVLLVTLLQRRTLSALQQQVKGLEARLLQLAEPQTNRPLASATSGFSAHLKEAEKTQHQSHQELKEKLKENNAVKTQWQTDKYRYAVALAAQGQSVDSIAQALNMAPAEVEQVMLLAQVKRPA